MWEHVIQKGSKKGAKTADTLSSIIPQDTALTRKGEGEALKRTRKAFFSSRRVDNPFALQKQEKGERRASL